MSRRFSVAGILHAGVSILLCGLYVAVGGQKAMRALVPESTQPVTSRTAFHSTDLYLRELTRMPNGSQRFIQIFAGLPPRKTVYIFVPEGDTFCSFVGSIIIYLGWPNEVITVEVRQDNAEHELRSINPESCAAIIFCGLKLPPWITTGIQLGTNLIIVPLNAEKKREP